MKLFIGITLSLLTITACLIIIAAPHPTAKEFPANAGDLDLIHGTSGGMTADFIWPDGSLSRITLPPLEGVTKIYLCGLTSDEDDSQLITCQIRYQDKSGKLKGGTMTQILDQKPHKPSNGT